MIFVRFFMPYLLYQENQLLIKGLRFTNFQDFRMGIGTSIFGRRSHLNNMFLAVNRKGTKLVQNDVWLSSF